METASGAARVLIVDDDPGATETLADILRLEHYEVATAHSGAAGAARIEANGFRAVLMDMIMPGVNGVQVVRRVKRVFPPLRVILMTAYSRHELIEEAKREGVCEVLSKPLDLDRVLALLGRLTRSDGTPP